MSSEAVHCIDTSTVRFAIYPGGFDDARILAQITDEALRDVFGAAGDGASLLDAYSANAAAIDARALACHRLSPGHPVVLTAEALAAPAIWQGDVAARPSAPQGLNPC